jgi:hypothetical protein
MHGSSMAASSHPHCSQAFSLPLAIMRKDGKGRSAGALTKQNTQRRQMRSVACVVIRTSPMGIYASLMTAPTH